MRFLRYILFPFAIIYWMITGLRNAFYSLGIFRSTSFSVPVINVGNLSMGGTGKTPHVEYLIRLLKDEFNVATLSRGYGRKEYGFKIADENSGVRQIGDEPLQYFKKFGDHIKVAVESNRVTGMMDLCRENPETQVVLLDDAYQHRAIKPGKNILVTPYDQPYYTDWILPVGDLRECRLGKKRADIIILSKCPELEEKEKRAIISKINPNDQQNVFFSRLKYGKIISLTKENELKDLQGRSVILVTGIGNPKPLADYIAGNNRILHHFSFPDHHKFKPKDLQSIHNIFDKFAGEDPVILTTEKDAMRLLDEEFKPELEDKPWFYQTITVEIENKNKFDKIILDYVKENN